MPTVECFTAPTPANIRSNPWAWLFPATADDVQAAVELAARHRVPLLPRGGGSSLAGQCVGPGLVIDTTKYMDRILAVDKEAGTATVQAGISIGILNRTLDPLGLMLGPDPASADRASVGGSIGNNATGSHSILYGMMADNLLETNVVLSDGSAARFGSVTTADLASRGRGNSLEAQIYREVPAIVRAQLEQILERWPRHWRRVSGLQHSTVYWLGCSTTKARPTAKALVLSKPASMRARLGFDSLYRSEFCDAAPIDQIQSQPAARRQRRNARYRHQRNTEAGTQAAHDSVGGRPFRPSRRCLCRNSRYSRNQSQRVRAAG